MVAQFRDNLKAQILQVPIDIDEAMKIIKYRRPFILLHSLSYSSYLVESVAGI